MNQRCSKCEQSFAIEARDLAFYDKVSPVLGGKKYPVPTPKLCPDCRQQRRMAFRNERKLYNRTCDLCQKPTITIYSPDRLFPVYCATCWWSDQWDPISYGQSYDLSRNFFAQWQELWQKVPKLGLLVWGDGINSDYTHDVIKCTNSYLIFDGEQSKDSFYGETFYDIKDCSDFLRIKNCELGYELINCTNCYNLTYSSFSENCSDSSFLLDCIGCKNCFGCANLQQKQFYLFNQPYSQEEYLRIVKSFELHNYQKLSEMKKKVETFFANQPRRAYRGRMNENSSGNNLDNSENTFDSFDSRGLRDSRFCTNIMLNGTDCYDVDGWGENTALIYNSAMVRCIATRPMNRPYTAPEGSPILPSPSRILMRFLIGNLRQEMIW